MNSTYNPGRVAGLWYLLLIAIGPFFLIYIPGKLYVKRDAVAMVLLRLHSFQINASLVLAGAWLLPLAALVYRSRFLPRFLGVWLAFGGFAWLILSFVAILAPEYQDKLFAIFQPAFFGEIALMLWLIVKGAKPPALDAAVPLSAAD